MSSERPVSLAPPTPLQVLVVSESEELRRVASAALESTGDVARIAGDLSGAISIADNPDVAFVDVTLPAGTALAVVHHLVATSARCAVYAVAPVGELAQAAEALSLGARGLLVAPISGDAALQALGEVRAARAARDRMAALEAARDTLAEQCDLLLRVVRVARTGDLRQAAETLAGLVAVASGARGVAVFGPEDRERSRQRLAAFGTALDLRERYDDGELADMSVARAATVHHLFSEDRSLGCVLVERVKTPNAPRLAEILEVSSAILALTHAARATLEDQPTNPKTRGLPIATFERLLEREVEAAAKASRAFSLVCVLPEPGASIDVARLSAPMNEPGSLCSVGSGGEAYVLLARTPLSAARDLLRGLPYRAAGLAGYPVDALAGDRLLRLAETRAKEAWRSPVLIQGLATLSLAEIAQTLLSTPTLESRIGSVFPLELTVSSAASLVLHTCRQALRGDLTVHVAGSGALEKVAREVVSDRVVSHAIARAPGCENLEVLVLLGEMGTWTLCGKLERERLRAVHSADALLATVVSERLERVARRSGAPKKEEAS